VNRLRGKNRHLHHFGRKKHEASNADNKCASWDEDSFSRSIWFSIIILTFFSLSLSLSFLKKIMHNCIFTVFSAKNANKYLEFIMNLQRVWDCIIRLKKLLVVPKKFVPIKKVCLFGKKKILSLFDPFTIRVLLALPSKRACDFKTWFSKTQLNIWKNYGLTFKITI
jgi:hypothetical protein